MTAVLDRPAAEALAARTRRGAQPASTTPITCWRWDSSPSGSRTSSVRFAKSSDDVTRRTFIAGGLGLGTAVLFGCGDDDAAPKRSSGRDGGFPVMIEHRYGATRIAAEPRRVVTVGATDHDPLLALGVTPVGLTAQQFSTGQPFAVWPWAQEDLGDARPAVLPFEQMSFEKIAALRPDLIVGAYSGMTKAEYAKLSRIAPTVAPSGEYVDYGTPWQEMTRVIGRSVGRARQAERLIADVEGRFARARESHPEFEGATAVYAGVIAAGKYYAETRQSARVGILTALGFEVPAEITRLANGRFFANISQERMRLLDHDVVMWEVGDRPQLRRAIEHDPLYRRLDVARERRDIFVEDEVVAAALALVSVRSLPLALDRLMPVLAAAIDGKPATVAPS